ncbi:crossover junction endodeoxyribonuclease RuvC [Candidatus Berkelbacteria bacterium RBG_13_40_8]|uniref:Crossover junction endodeoxyribonuclease RuvC n=1 Tax=Candidatus Berkelbacteria bacterium RBG_13_40_8 TaxID=1797467 RepID=A0A1F5DP97_9BACT|nr:MAG: crossover junction endodeoxyribonuclease RuvC [Candidatus Berkelbacteria bacterium RBG_13_40_8]
MRILGIDPGTARCGYGVIEVSDKNGAISWIGHGCIQTDKLLRDSERLNRVFNDIISLIEKFRPDQVAIELLFMFHNQKTVMKISEARGVILLACAKKGLALQTFEYTPMQVKLAVTGYGRSEKKEVISEVIKALNPARNIGKKKKDGFDDAADALAVAMAHFHKYVEEGIK